MLSIRHFLTPSSVGQMLAMLDPPAAQDREIPHGVAVAFLATALGIYLVWDVDPSGTIFGALYIMVDHLMVRYI